MRYSAPRWQTAASAWFGTRAVEFLTADRAFDVAPLYSALRELPLSGEAWGVIFAAYTAGAVLSAYTRSEPLKLAVGIAGVALSMLFGVFVLLGYWQATEDFSGAGAFTLIVGVGLALGMKQWGRGNGWS